MKHLYTKGHKKYGGRKMGTPNKSKELADRIFSSISSRNIEEDLQELHDKYLPKYWDIVSRFLPKTLGETYEDNELVINILGFDKTKKDKK